MAKKKSGGAGKYPKPNLSIQQAANNAAKPQMLGNNFGSNGQSPAEKKK